jgi:hypothetical protein
MTICRSNGDFNNDEGLGATPSPSSFLLSVYTGALTPIDTILSDQDVDLREDEPCKDMTRMRLTAA